MNAQDVRSLFRFIDWMMKLPRDLDDMFWQEVSKTEEKKKMPFITTPERLGREARYLKGIETVLEVKFGDSGLQLMPEIRQIRDHEKLAIVLDATKTATSPDELRKLWRTDEE